MSYSLIYARSLNHCIGKDGHIPWRLPNDFKHFKKTTMGSAVIMGRKTYEDHCCAFPGRLNIVVSRNADYEVVEGVHLVTSLDDAIALAKKHEQAIFIIGGVQFFSSTMENAATVYETVVDAEVQGDAYLPKFSFEGWTTELLSEQSPDEKHPFGFKVLKHSR